MQVERGPRKSEDLWGDEKARRQSVSPGGDDAAPRGPDINQYPSGKIEDAEFEDIDDRNRGPHS